jgi:hypothetical protein
MYATSCGLDGRSGLLRLRASIAHRLPYRVLSGIRPVINLSVFDGLIFASNLAQGRRCARHSRSTFPEFSTPDIATSCAAGVMASYER